MTAPATEIFTPQHRLSMLVHAGSKIGKSTLTGTSPKPILVLDAEGSWRFIPVRQIAWDPTVGPPPACDGTWDACVVSVRTWETVEFVYRWLTQYETCFTSVIVDSITEIQRRCKQNMKGQEALKIQDWGVLLAVMDGVIRGFRDLTLLPTSSVRCVIFVAETRQRPSDDKWVPYMQGQISVSLPYWVDICGYLYPDHEVDANGQPTVEIRRLLISPHPQYEAGERVQGRLGKSVVIRQAPAGQAGSDVENWMKIIYGLEGAQPAAIV